jgi:hypothetical protein
MKNENEKIMQEKIDWQKFRRQQMEIARAQAQARAQERKAAQA